MAKVSDNYIIHFKGLKIGKHLFEYEVNNLFFDQFPEGEIKHGNLNVSAELDKHSTMLELNINIEGMVEVACDRCLEPVIIPLIFAGRLIVKYGEIVDTENDELWIINENENELSLAQYIYESICLSLPIQRYHGIEGTSQQNCDASMLTRINRVEDITKNNDPRWDELNKFKS